MAKKKTSKKPRRSKPPRSKRPRAKPSRSGRRRKPPVPQEPLERVFLWGDDVRVITNEEIYLQLVRDGAFLRPATVANDREWMHDDMHGDDTKHTDRWEHDDFSYHNDWPRQHLDDHGDRAGAHNDSGLLPPEGGHGDKTGSHLDRWISHGDESGHYDGQRHADRPPEHWDKHYDTFEGHWDERRRPKEHVDA